MLSTGAGRKAVREISTGIDEEELVVGHAAGKRTLPLRDYQHEYVFVDR